MQVGNPSETQTALAEVIQHHHLHGFRQTLAAAGERLGQRKLTRRITPHAGTGEVAEVLTDQRPLQQL